RNATNSADALNGPFTGLGETPRASAANARQFARVGFGERFRAQALISAQAPSRAASFFRAVEGSPDTGASPGPENKGPRRSGAGGGTSSAYSDYPGDGGVVGAAASP